jgi:hypothetical protein
VAVYSFAQDGFQLNLVQTISPPSEMSIQEISLEPEGNLWVLGNDPAAQFWSWNKEASKFSASHSDLSDLINKSATEGAIFTPVLTHSYASG